MPQILGTLLPLTALTSQTKENNLFSAGENFIPWLIKTHQQVWQLLPLHPTTNPEMKLSASPYSGFGIGLNPLYVSLAKDKGLPEVDVGFLNKHKDWLEDYALFMALVDNFHSHDWTTWPKQIRKREPEAMQNYQQKLSIQINYYRRLQFYLHQEFTKLELTAEKAGITLIGDIPFYLSFHSPLVWAHQNCFLIDPNGLLPFMSGAEGGPQFIRQVWEHPLYNWANFASVINLWKIRLAYARSIYTWVRLDSAIRFYTYGKMHPNDPSKDSIATAPGDVAFDLLISYCQEIGLQVFTEDVTGYDLKPLHQAMAKHLVPGVSVFSLSLAANSTQFDLNLFDPKTSNTNDFFYSSTHDTPTLLGFVQNLSPAQKHYICSNLDLPSTSDNLSLARLVRQYLLTHCRRIILPLQDWLLTTDRINVPGTVSPHNWSYRIG